jgi:acetyl-CoA carboxylase biotin carboxylase subunit
VFRTILVANRGVIARRIVRACRQLGVRSVAVYSDADRDAPHVRDADDAVRIGAAPARDSYLNSAAIVEAARHAKAEAIHPGYGFLSENAEFAEACIEAGVTFIGPSADAIRAMGDKTQGRRLMASAGVPVLPGTETAVADAPAARHAAEAIGFPVMLKAAAGGGGIGLVRVERASELDRAFAAASRRAAAAFGDGALYVERWLAAPRHVEVQVFGDGRGEVVHLHERDCSVQRRHQKLVEEAPAVGLPEATLSGLFAAAVAGARAIRYANAGTIEFLVDRDGGFYFLEMNTRLQVEHAVTEALTGVDLVVAQLRVAAGEGLPWRQPDIVRRGAVIESRVYAEDPDKGFLPSPGVVTRLRVPTSQGIRVESGVDVGSHVTVHYDPLVLKLIAAADSRADAIERMDAALADLVLDGVRTTIPFLRRVMAHPDFREGRVHTQMVEQGAFNA